jgi:hypothetical protein
MIRILKSSVQERLPGRLCRASARGWGVTGTGLDQVAVQRFDGAVAPNLAQLVQLDAVVGGIRQRHIAHVAERGGIRHARRHDLNRSR